MSLSVYVHIPFCSRRCDYCDFATWTDKNENVDEYIEALLHQWKFHAGQFDGKTPLTSIFFGGGTPNYIDEKYICRIIEEISNTFLISDLVEITVEANPDHVTLNKMRTYQAAGVNRISMGIQSTNVDVLEFLGREHNPEHVIAARDIVAKSGIENVSGDLIYGSAIESIADWQNTLEEVITLDLNHISAYALGIEKGTLLAASVADGRKSPTNDDDLANKYELADAILLANGFNWYEISNWARKGKESIHNLVYWRGGEVIALGCAAHGFTMGNRWSTPRNINTYIEKFGASNNAKQIDESFFLNQDHNGLISRDQEQFALKLRTRQGVRWPQRQVSKGLAQYLDAELISFDPENRNVSLTVKGRLLANRLAVDLYEEHGHLTDVVE